MSGSSSQACADILERVSAYIDQELDPEVCRQIEAHCAGCAACGQVIDSLRQTIGLCRATGERPLPPPVREKARASVQRLLSEMRRE